MNQIRTTTLSFQPSANQWTLHVPVSTLKKLVKQNKMVHLGRKEKGRELALSSSPPKYNSFSTKIKVAQHQQTLTAGPLIGILTVRRGAGFKGNKRNFIDIMRMGKQLGALVYVFAAEDIDWSTNTVGAFLYDETKNSWKRASEMPLPDVVYNRIPYRADEEKEFAQRAINRLTSMPSLRLFNSHFFNKWHLYEKLSKDPKVGKYVPDTIKFETSKDLLAMVNKHPFLYLKPIDGKAGQGIMTVETSGERHILKQRIGSKLVVRADLSQQKLWELIKETRQKGYVLQQGVHLATYNQRPFDIRVLIQKDRTGTFQLSGIGIRVAGKNSITTHVPRGGSIAAPDIVLRHARPADHEQMIKRIQQVALGLATALEDRYPGLAEMSMDIGLDTKGQLWFFEANAKPMKFDEPHIRKLSLERIIEYSQYLSKFTAKEERSHASKTNNA
ncbi:hypothetical protein BEP19_04855 [Ammoniphilus oxalaticus]|uniref:ATP-grasp domain-containing protein n=1 Tax=Ammoniphilus oxalaticus TaxID=66863 RepID=A0A419SII3_9BACL|nr:YheC/YheD family protein [Ammoniphilus oxalaticus]RKD23762.1 hypothetical protein BEP19_04855 [Ammoniphilus oxalaticus]